MCVHSVLFDPPVFGRRGPVALSPILEPVANLGGGEAGGLGQLPLLAGIGIGV